MTASVERLGGLRTALAPPRGELGGSGERRGGHRRVSRCRQQLLPDRRLRPAADENLRPQGRRRLRHPVSSPITRSNSAPSTRRRAPTSCAATAAASRSTSSATPWSRSGRSPVTFTGRHRTPRSRMHRSPPSSPRGAQVSSPLSPGPLDGAPEPDLQRRPALGRQEIIDAQARSRSTSRRTCAALRFRLGSEPGRTVPDLRLVRALLRAAPDGPGGAVVLLRAPSAHLQLQPDEHGRRTPKPKPTSTAARRSSAASPRRPTRTCGTST